MTPERQELPKNTLENRRSSPREIPVSAQDENRLLENDTKNAVRIQQQEAARVARTTAQERKDPLLVRVESLLSEGLSDEYAMLSPQAKRAFREEGERIAQWLHSALTRGTVHSHEVLARLESWLLIIEGKNRSSPWLLQEAYIRARRILREMQSAEGGH